MKSDPFCLFDAANSKWQVLSLDQFVIALQTFQGDFQTCVLEIEPVRGARANLAALLVRGQVINLYKVDRQSTRLDSRDLMAALPGGRSALRMRVLVLTPYTARLVKILLEQRGNETSASIKSEHLEQVVDGALQSPAPLLLHASWPSAQGLALLPGSGLPPRHALFIASNQILHSAGGMNALYGWKEPACRVRLYRSQEITPAWQEYFLHFAFSWLAGYLLGRYEELTGRLLSNAIIRDLNFTTSANGWNISVSATNITDQAVFSSPQEAGQVYQRLLGILLHHAGPMLGASLTDMILREGLTRLQAPYRLVYEQFRAYEPV